jgi:hypothetical protein
MSLLALRRVFWVVLASVLIIGFAPVGIRFDSFSNCLGQRGGGIGFERRGVAESTNLTIENLSSGTILVSSFSLSWPEVFSEKLIVASPPNLGSDASPRFSLMQGESIFVKGVFGDVRFTAENTGSTTLRVWRNSHLKQFDVGGSRQIESPAINNVCTQTKPLFAQMFNDQIDQTHGTITVGSKSIDNHSLTENARFSVLVLGLQSYLRGLLIVLSVFTFLFLIGIGFLRMGNQSINNSIDFVAGINSSMFILLLPISAMSYFFAIGQIVKLVIVFGLVMYGLSLRRKSCRLSSIFLPFRQLKLRFDLGLMSLSFLPIFYFGTIYAGQYKTDLFENGRLISLLRNHSLFEMQKLPEAMNAGVLTSGAGISWRTLDSASAAFLSELFNVRSVGGYLIFAMVGYVSFTSTIFALCRRVDSKFIERLLLMLALTSPFFIGLFIENYYAQYLFVAFAPATVLSIARFFESSNCSAKIDRRKLFFMAASITFSLCLYPYFAVVLYGPLLIYVFFGKGLSKEKFMQFGKFCAYVAGFSNLHLIPILNFKEGLTYSSFLNELTKYTLLGPFNRGELAQLMAGFQPYQLRNFSYPSGVPDNWMFDLFVVSNQFLNNFRVLFFVFAALFVGITLNMFLKKNTESTVIKIASISFLVYVIALALLGSTYAEFKAIWTFLALFPMLFSQSIKYFSKKWLLVPLIPSAIFWSMTTFADQSSWYMNPQSRIVATNHMTAYVDLFEVEKLIENFNREIVFLQGDEPLQGSDRDRVLLQHLLISAEDNGRRSTIEFAIDDVKANKDSLYITIGRISPDRTKNMRMLYDGLHVQVFSD